MRDNSNGTFGAAETYVAGGGLDGHQANWNLEVKLEVQVAATLVPADHMGMCRKRELMGFFRPCPHLQRSRQFSLTPHHDSGLLPDRWIPTTYPGVKLLKSFFLFKFKHPWIRFRYDHDDKKLVQAIAGDRSPLRHGGDSKAPIELVLGEWWPSLTYGAGR